MTTRGAFAALALFTTAISGATAIGHAAPLAKGTIEVAPALSFSHQSLSFRGAGGGVDAGSVTTLTGTTLVGYCVSNKVEIVGGALVGYQSLNSPGSTSQSATSVGAVAGIQYNLAPSGSYLPYLRAGAGLATNAGNLSLGDETTWIAPLVDAGVRVMVGDVAAVNVGIGYQRRANALGLQDLSAHVVGLEIGVSIFTRRGP